MTAPGRDTVTELHVEATLRVDVPLDRGNELAIGAADSLEEADAVRFADVLELGDVDAGEDGLSVAVDCRLTLHFEDPLPDAEPSQKRVREKLVGGRLDDSDANAVVGADDILGIDRLEVVDGPYAVESW